MTSLRVFISLSFVATTVGDSIGQSTDVVHEVIDSEDVFRWGIERRANAARAREDFQLAAVLFDREWESPYRGPSAALALNRGRAHYFAGNLPQAIRAFRDGLELFPWDAELQHGLTVCRAAIAYPTETGPAERVRPDPLTSLRYRFSQWDLLAASLITALLTTIGLARRLTALDSWSGPVAGLGLTGLLAVSIVSLLIERDRVYDRDHPIVVVTEPAILRTGNGTTFAPRINAPLPRGSEVRELTRRGGWVQVELPGGAAGWLPEAVLLK